MALKKPVSGEVTPKTLWEQEAKAITIKKFAEQTAETEKILWFGESNSGKTHGYLDVLRYLKKIGTSPEKVCMCIVFSDRATGITKLYHLIPKEYVERVHIFPVNDYEDLIKATGTSEKILLEHFKNTGVHGWLIVELLEESWRMSQDNYSRKAFGETLADLMSAKRRAIVDLKQVKDEKKKESAYQALEGWRDWTVIKFFHNFNWIDRIKKMPFNVGATAEIKEIDNPDSVFSAIKVRPAGEKDNAHRFDTIIYKKHVGNKFYQRCFKWTGMSRLYSDIDITDKNGYEMHKQIEKNFIEKGYKSSAIEELEKEANIPTPPKEPPVEGTHEAIEDHQKMAEDKAKEKTITSISKTEGEKKISQEELTKKPKEESKEEKKEAYFI